MAEDTSQGGRAEMLDQLKGSENPDAVGHAEVLKMHNLEIRVLMFGKEVISEEEN
jgi:hypothetical protein